MGRWPRHLSHLTRREALGMLGAGAGLALTPGPGRAAPARQAATDIAFPEGAVIRTILEDLAPEALGGGATLFHEHLDLSQNYSSPPVERDPAAGPLTDEEAETFVALVAEELRMETSPDIPEADKVRMVLNVLEAGYEDQVLLASDFAASRDLKSNWGNGFATAIVQFVPKLRHAGVDDATLHKITVDNPRRFLAFVPQEA